jgi:hypothetical protein
MTKQDILEYNSPINIVSTLMGLSSLSANSFTQEFITFAPYISSNIIAYQTDVTGFELPKINLYCLLYREEVAEFIYNYATNNNLEYVVQQVMIEDALTKNISLAGKVAVTNIEDWHNFTHTVNKAAFKSFSVSLSGDKVLVFFM